jgi:hypothetical protein
MKEQLKVDNKGKFHEPTGYVKNASIEKAERGLTEGDVTPMVDTFRTDSYTVHTGIKTGSPVRITHNKTGTTKIISHPDARTTLYKHGDNLTDKHVENILYQGEGGKHGKPETMKEEAKKAALSIVAKRKETSGEKVKRFLGALEGPGRLKTSEKPKLVNKEEKIHNEKGEHLGDVMEITGSHAKDPTKTVKKFRAERNDGKTLITADKKAAHEFLENK